MRVPVGMGRGVRLRLDLSHELMQALGLYEWELAGHLQRLGHGSHTCFDVGAAIGYESLAIARGSGAQVVAFEVDDVAAERFEENLRLNPELRPRVRLLRCRVGDGDGSSVAIDDLLAGELGGAPQLIKIDVEGDEVEVLAGARGLLTDHQPAVVLEVHSEALERECRRLLEGHNYCVRVVDRRWWLRESRPMSHNRWLVAEAG